MKRNMSVLLAALLALMLCVSGCGGKEAEPAAEAAPEEAQDPEGTEPEEAAEELSDQEKADEVAALIDAIYVQKRTDETDAQCTAAKEAWDEIGRAHV